MFRFNPYDCRQTVMLNYVVTSNHIHLLVIDSGPDVIPNSIEESIRVSSSCNDEELQERLQSAIQYQ